MKKCKACGQEIQPKKTQVAPLATVALPGGAGGVTVSITNATDLPIEVIGAADAGGVALVIGKPST